jgi:plastocyanin
MTRRLPTHRELVIVAIAALALFGARCSKEPPPSAPPGESVQSKTAPSSKVIGKGPRAAGGFPAIIVLEPQAPREFPVPTEPKVMDQQGLAFIPGLLLVRRDQQVIFRNSEDVLHNVRVQETGAAQPVFNVATIPGNSYTHTFDRPGFYSVGCDVHQEMHADILVTSTPYAVVADDDGNFEFSDVLPGAYKITVYLGARRIERLVEVAGPRTELVVEDM